MHAKTMSGSCMPTGVPVRTPSLKGRFPGKNTHKPENSVFQRNAPRARPRCQQAASCSQPLCRERGGHNGLGLLLDSSQMLRPLKTLRVNLVHILGA